MRVNIHPTNAALPTKQKKPLRKGGMHKICDAEAMGLFQRLGQHVMLRFTVMTAVKSAWRVLP